MKLKEMWKHVAMLPARIGMAMDQVAGLSESNNGLCEAVGTLVGDNDATLRATRAAKGHTQLPHHQSSNDYLPIRHN